MLYFEKNSTIHVSGNSLDLNPDWLDNIRSLLMRNSNKLMDIKLILRKSFHRLEAAIQVCNF